MQGTISLWKAGTKLNRSQRDKILLQNRQSPYLVTKGQIPSSPIFPNQKRTIRTSLKVPKKGRYFLYVKGHFKEGQPFTKEQFVTVVPSQ